VDRRTRNLFAAALVLVIVITCGAALVLGGPGGSGGPPGTESVVGVVTEVDATSLSDVCCFTLRTSDGQTLMFELGQLQNGVDFPPGHLAEHQATATPIRVWWKAGLDSRLAIRLEDAP
jgi:hypothetical protein